MNEHSEALRKLIATAKTEDVPVLVGAADWIDEAADVITDKCVTIERYKKQEDRSSKIYEEMSAKQREALAESEARRKSLENLYVGVKRELELLNGKIAFDKKNKSEQIEKSITSYIPAKSLTDNIYRCGKCGRKLKLWGGQRATDRYRFCPKCGNMVAWELSDIPEEDL